MAVSYPLMMPTTGVKASEFELVMQDAVNDVAGASYATEIAPPYWDINISTAEMTRTNPTWRKWRAFLDNLRGSKKVGLFYDPDAPRPIEYMNSGLPATRAGGGSFNGVCPVTTITDRHTVVIGSAPAAFQLRQADYVGFIEDGRYFLARVAEDAVSDGAGVLTITFEPELPFTFTSAADVNFDKPVTEGFLQGRPSASRQVESGSISFNARSRMF